MIKNETHPFSNTILTINSSLKDQIYSDFIHPKIKKFFDAREITSYLELDYNYYISDIDFKNCDFSFFYQEVFKDITKNNSNELNFAIKYCITFDKKLCQKYCDKSQFFFESINAFKKPILFFIYFEIQEVYDFIREISNQAN